MAVHNSCLPATAQLWLEATATAQLWLTRQWVKPLIVLTTDQAAFKQNRRFDEVLYLLGCSWHADSRAQCNSTTCTAKQFKPMAVIMRQPAHCSNSTTSCSISGLQLH
jgi:hypothetical protein